MENKTSKYFKYAIGEIILVVIGILIALSINNWNEDRKLKAYEQTMLLEVQKQLLVDYDRVVSLLPLIEQIMHNIHEVAAIKTDLHYPADSLQYHMNKINGFGVAVSFNTSAYDSVKSGGLEKISNPELRNLLAELYGNSIPTVINWVNEIIRGSLFNRQKLINFMYHPKVSPGEGNSITYDLIIHDPELIRNRPEFDELLHTLHWPMPIAKRLLISVKGKMEQVDKLITQELK